MVNKQKSHTETINLKCHLQHGMINLNCLIDQIMYQIFKIIDSRLSRNMKP